MLLPFVAAKRFCSFPPPRPRPRRVPSSLPSPFFFRAATRILDLKRARSVAATTLAFRVIRIVRYRSLLGSGVASLSLSLPSSELLPASNYRRCPSRAARRTDIAKNAGAR